MKVQAQPEFLTVAEPGKENCFETAKRMCYDRFWSESAVNGFATASRWLQALRAQVAAMEGAGGWNTTTREHEYNQGVLRAIRRELAELTQR